MLSYAHCVREDPTRKGLLYLGTENGLYVSFNDGENWEPLQANLPRAPVYWMVIQEHFNDLVVGTYGRGFWILDDLTPIQQMTDAMRSAAAPAAYLFPPRSTYRFRAGTVPVTMSDDPTAGQNPPYGAAINYYLKTAPKDEVKIRIEDSKGQTVRTLTGTKNVGINRVTWDLRGELSKEVKMRTSPSYAPEITQGTDGTRPAQGAPRISVLLPPGSYVVKLLLNSQEFSQPLVVKKDPNSSGTDAEIQTQIAMLLELRSEQDKAAEMVNQIELIRSQLYSIKALVDTQPSAEGGSLSTTAGNGSTAAKNDYATIKAAVDGVDIKLIDIEEQLIQRKLTGQGQDGVRWPARLLTKIGYLANGLSGSDFGPTSQQREVQALFTQQLSSLRKRLDDVLSKDLETFNKLLRDRGIQNVLTRTP